MRFPVLNLFHVKIAHTSFFVSNVNERYLWQTEESEMTVWQGTQHTKSTPVLILFRDLEIP